MNIAIDGPGGAGKSTVAKEVASRLHMQYLDTGALYRTVGYVLDRNGVDLRVEQEVEKHLPDLNVALVYDEANVQHVLVNGEDLTSYIRTPEAGKCASKVAVHACVREKLLGIQRDAARRYDVIMDGRDIGTVVLPDADLKFFITATTEERARRRLKELVAAGAPHGTLEQTISEIAERDNRDMNRKVAPLRQAEDAIYLDTTDMTREEVVDFVCDKVEKKAEELALTGKLGEPGEASVRQKGTV